MFSSNAQPLKSSSQCGLMQGNNLRVAAQRLYIKHLCIVISHQSTVRLGGVSGISVQYRPCSYFIFFPVLLELGKITHSGTKQQLYLNYMNFQNKMNHRHVCQNTLWVIIPLLFWHTVRREMWWSHACLRKVTLNRSKPITPQRCWSST